MQDSGLFVGALSGTSADGIDVGLFSFDEHSAELVGSLIVPYSESLREKALTLPRKPSATLEQLGSLSVEIGLAFSSAITTCLEKENVKASDVRAIGFHGQTIFHAPQGAFPFTWQLGDPAVVAAKTGIPVASNFRATDIAHGGQGAPLAPLFHEAYFSSSTENRVVVNIGGISNITYLPKARPAEKGFDAGPGNCLMDAWIARHKGLAFDRDGQWASTGKPVPEILTQLHSDDFFSKIPPKSTGTEYFHLGWLEKHLDSSYAPEDIQATLLALTAETIVAAITHCGPVDAVYVCGGGGQNTALMDHFSMRMGDIRVRKTDALGLPSDWIEAGLFAMLAKRRFDHQPSNTTNTTGGSASILGSLNYP